MIRQDEVDKQRALCALHRVQPVLRQDAIAFRAKISPPAPGPPSSYHRTVSRPYGVRLPGGCVSSVIASSTLGR
jgi:hypothetical protein